MKESIVLGLLAFAVACAGPMSGSRGPFCDAFEGAGGLAVGQQPEPGRYTLRMRRLEGAPVAIVSGELTLLARESSEVPNRDVTGDPLPALAQPLWGYTDAPISTVGALFGGVATSRDSETPGVVVGMHHGHDPESWSVSMEFGPDPDLREMIILDGAATLATITQVTPRGFAGTWFSYAGPTNYHMAGDFCAERRG